MTTSCFLPGPNSLFSVLSAEELVREIEQYQCLRALRLEGNTVGVDAAQAIAKVLEGKDLLQVLLILYLVQCFCKLVLHKLKRVVTYSLILSDSPRFLFELTDIVLFSFPPVYTSLYLSEMLLE